MRLTLNPRIRWRPIAWCGSWNFPVLGNNPFVDSARVDTLRMGKRDEVVEPSYVSIIPCRYRDPRCFPFFDCTSFTFLVVCGPPGVLGSGLLPRRLRDDRSFFSAWPFLSPKERSSSSFRTRRLLLLLRGTKPTPPGGPNRIQEPFSVGAPWVAERKSEASGLPFVQSAGYALG